VRTVLDIMKAGYTFPPALLGGSYRVRRMCMNLEENLLRYTNAVLIGHGQIRKRYGRFFNTRYSNISDDIKSLAFLSLESMKEEIDRQACPDEKVRLHISRIDDAWKGLEDAKKKMGI